MAPRYKEKLVTSKEINVLVAKHGNNSNTVKINSYNHYIYTHIGFTICQAFFKVLYNDVSPHKNLIQQYLLLLCSFIHEETETKRGYITCPSSAMSKWLNQKSTSLVLESICSRTQIHIFYFFFRFNFMSLCR